MLERARADANVHMHACIRMHVCILHSRKQMHAGACTHMYVFLLLDVRSLDVASLSRQSENQPIVDDLALIEHAHIFRMRRTVATCHG